jgi:hypothetical protein
MQYPTQRPAKMRASQRIAADHDGSSADADACSHGAAHPPSANEVGEDALQPRSEPRQEASPPIASVDCDQDAVKLPGPGADEYTQDAPTPSATDRGAAPSASS